VLSVLVTAVLVTGGLSACQVKVGKAAFVDNTTITENEVNRYVEPTAAAPDGSSPGPKTLATQELVKQVILNELAGVIGHLPSDSDLATLHDSALSTAFNAQVEGADADKQLRAAVAERGLKPNFDALFTRNAELSTAIEGYLQSAGSDQQQKLRSAITAMKVRVNPRYGTWSTNNLALDGGAVPSWLRSPA